MIDWTKRGAEIAGEWRENPRLRYGVYVMLAILWLYAILVLRDVAIEKRQAWQGVEARISKAKSLAASGDWVSRGAEAKSALADFESALWKEGSTGFAQAAVQESLNRSLAASGLSSRRVGVSVSDTPISAELPDILPIRARVSLDFREAALYSWLAGLRGDPAEKKPAVVVESLTIKGAPTPVVDVELVAYALKPADVSSSGSSK